MDDREWTEAESRERRNDRFWKGLALFAALVLAFGMGLILGGGLTYGLTRLADWLPTGGPRGIDPDSGILVASVADDGPVAADDGEPGGLFRRQHRLLLPGIDS